MPPSSWDQERAAAHPGPAGDALDHRGQLADDLNRTLRAGLVLGHEERAISDVVTLNLQHVCRPLAGQQGDVHRVPQSWVGLVPNGPKLGIGDAAIAIDFGEAFHPLARVYRVGVSTHGPC